jgi:hypothetical protein
MTKLALLHLHAAAKLAMTGVIWCVQVVHYPSLDSSARHGARPTEAMKIAIAGMGISGLTEHYLNPMTVAIWSTEPDRILEAPAKLILRFLDNHHLLGTRDYHPWRVIKGGFLEPTIGDVQLLSGKPLSRRHLRPSAFT